jgi:DUF4097 and DUF4098 domain-containing protein YvlB
MRTLIPAGRRARLIPALMLLAAGSAFAGEEVDQRLAAAARGTVEIGNVAGTVTVLGTQKNEVHVSGDISEDARLDFSVDGEHTVVKVVLPKHSMHGGSSDISVEVPAGSALTVSTVSADATVEGVRGSLDLQTVSGNIETQSYDEDAKLRSVSGDISVRGNGGSAVLNLVTVSGNAEVKNAGGETNVQSVSGDLNLHLNSVARSRLRTTSGTVTLYGELTKDARVEGESVSGDVNFYLAGTRDGDYDLATATGEISNCFGPEPVEHKYGPGMELKFRQGSSDATLRARTLSGDISLCKD